jgi:magnesium-transporting ATPase (P-type)
MCLKKLKELLTNSITVSLKDFEPRLKKLETGNRKTFIDSYFKVATQVLNTISWVMVFIFVSIGSLFLNPNFSSNFFNIIIIYIIFFAALILPFYVIRKDLRADLYKLMEILEFEQKKLIKKESKK